ncbi:MAG: TetR/AcrR family transcriptional regulator [Phenylobacterium sp.]|uniref:TetR/AcrR family transcriptional regulator n=1 Tax=Phenylobacterium sp. TaxID=1871053 RepID=UPI00391D4CA4
MPRIPGQIDLAKREAILNAAGAVLSERGMAASMAEVARRAGVSKQTIYNHFGSKAELVSALSQRRTREMTAPLETPEAAGHPQDALAGFARSLLTTAVAANSVAFMRMVIQGAADMPELARALYEAGPRASRARLADYLAAEHAAGRLEVPDPPQAAEFFGGMALGSYQMAGLLGADRTLDDAAIEAIAREAAARFLRAYGR